MAIQYSLSYDDKGNPSLTKNTISGSRKVIDTDNFNIGAYTPTRTVSTNYTFQPIDEYIEQETFGTQTQYEILQAHINENQGGNNGDDFDDDSVAKEFTLSVDQQTKVDNLKAAGMEQEAKDFEKYSLNQNKAKELRTVTGVGGLFITNPVVTVLGVGAKIYDLYADRKISEIMDGYYASNYYQEKITLNDYEWDAYHGHDVYSDEGFLGQSLHGDGSSKDSGNVEGGLGTETMSDIQSKERGQSLHGGNTSNQSVNIGQSLHGGNGRSSGDHDSGASAGAQSDAAAGMGGY